MSEYRSSAASGWSTQGTPARGGWPQDEQSVSYSAEDASREGSGVPRQGRRLSDKVLIAFHHACDVNDLEVADQLLVALETMLTRRPFVADAGRRRSMSNLVAAHERLWNLRHPDAEDA